MSWFVPYVPERVCKYLLQRYLGQFFEEKLTLDQLSVDLYNGKGTVEKVSLDVQALNELGEKQNWPLEFVDGYVEKLIVSIPFTAILKESALIEVHGLKLTLQPKQRQECATSMFESMWSSMTNSMQLAEECMKQDNLNSVDSAQPIEVIERFAQLIESVLSRVKVKFFNIVLQIEHVPQDSTTGVGVVINIDRMEYSDEAGNDPPTGETTDETASHEQKKSYVVSSLTTKNFLIEGVTFSTVEFPSHGRTFSRSVMTQSQSSVNGGDKEKEDSYIGLLTDKPDELQTVDADTSGESIEVLDQIEPAYNRHAILFAKLCNRQEIRIRLKQSEVVVGPKVSFEISLGAFLVFLSPRQVHLLLELADGLASPDNEDTSNVAPRQKYTEKPMNSLDYQRIEQELQQQLHPFSAYQTGGLQGAHGWSTAPLEDNDGDENFLPMKPARSSGQMTDSTNSATSSSLESSLMASSVTSSIVSDGTFRSRRKTSNIDSDPTAEISHFQIRLTSLAVVILHEDVLSTAPIQMENSLVVASVNQMKTLAERFFNELNRLEILTLLMKDFESCKAAFAHACSLSHLRLLAVRLQVEGDETTTSSAFSISGRLTVSRMELLECLTEQNSTMEYVPLLTFADQQNLHANSNFKLNFKHVQKTVGKNGSRRLPKPKTELSITLNTCTIELDITIVDRICALLNPQPICVIPKPHNIWAQQSTILPKSSADSSQIDVKVHCNCLSVRLRFPIPDFRELHDINRMPWWKRHVRSDFFLLRLHHANAQTTLQTNQPVRKYSLHCHGVDVFYYESAHGEPFVIGKATASDDKRTNGGGGGGGASCELIVTVYPLKKESVEMEPMDERAYDMTQSVYGAFGNDARAGTGPFSAKRVIHESDTPHAKETQEDTEELIMPGEKEEINEFIQTTTQDSHIQIDLNLPTITMQLISKHIYEKIYNRINNDLLLWQPSAPKPTTGSTTYEKFIPTTSTTAASNVQETPETFSMCKSGVQYGSDDSESDNETENDASSLFYSLCETSRTKPKTQLIAVNANSQSYLTLNLTIAQGLLNMYPPVRDSASNVIPGQHGEFLLFLENAHLFVVSGYRGDSNLGFVCVQAQNGHLYHCDMMSIPSQSPPLKEIGTAVGRHLHSTIYKSEPGVLVNANNRGGNREMISVAIRIQAAHETHHVKTIRVAVGINKATLKHRMCLEPNSWITHLCDFFNVLDYPIPEYKAKDVLTELHLHVWDCAIDYRPLYLPLRSVVTLGTFSMSSHLTAQANSSTLNFIAEECALFLTDKAPPHDGIASMAPVDLKRDYIRTIDLGLFELSLKTTDKKRNNLPHFDLRASNDTVHIRTCADSARALTQLLTYYAGDGDLKKPDGTAATATTAGGGSGGGTLDTARLVDLEPQEDASGLSKSQQQQVHDLLDDAMQESVNVDVKTPNDDGVGLSDGTKVFFFPDENATLPDNGVPLKQPQTTLPQIRWLSNESIRLGDSHLTVPMSKADALQPPPDFPNAVIRYTLCEMTIVWHLYGGSDFKPAATSDKDSSSRKKTVNFADTHVGDSVRFSNVNRGKVSFEAAAADEKKKTGLKWQEMGGPNRDHDLLMEIQLNKVRFRHDTYPETTEQASRQVLLVSDFEIRDRLGTSQINKFLYQHTSQARPKQSHANMLSIKTLHIRPDPKLKTQECKLKVSLLPLRLNIDQDALLFLIRFFKELGGGESTTTTSTAAQADLLPSKHNTPTHQPPVMTVSVVGVEKEVETEQAQKMVDQNLLILLEENKDVEESEQASVPQEVRSEETPPIYFRHVCFAPEVPIRLDYHGKRVDMTHGPLPGLLMGLAQLNCSELRLIRLSNRHGILGVDKLLSYFITEWLNDIKRNQLPSLLGGVGPMHSLVQLMQGIKDLFWMPIEQYQRDGRIVRGIQRGANSFTTSTAMAALELTSRLIHLIQITAETAYDMLSPGPSVRRTSKGKGKKKRYSQPQDIREGMTNAYRLVREGIGETADNIVRAASHEHEQKGYTGAVGGVIRQIPPTFVKPIIIASEATNNVLGGVRSQLVPDARREASQKWRNDDG